MSGQKNPEISLSAYLRSEMVKSFLKPFTLTNPEPKFEATEPQLANPFQESHPSTNKGALIITNTIRGGGVLLILFNHSRMGPNTLF